MDCNDHVAKNVLNIYICLYNYLSHLCFNAADAAADDDII